MDSKRQAAEAAASNGDNRTPARIFRDVKPKKERPHTTIVDEEGRTITDPQKTRERWHRHFCALLEGKSVDRNGAAHEHAQAPLPLIEYDPTMVPLRDEIVGVISKLSVGRAGGEDKIAADVLKSCQAQVARVVHPLIYKVALCWEAALGLGRRRDAGKLEAERHHQGMQKLPWNPAREPDGEVAPPLSAISAEIVS